MGAFRKYTGIDLTGDNTLLGDIYDGAENVVQKVGNTIESIVSDPKKLIAVAIMVAYPGAASAVGDFILGEALAVDALVASGTMTAAEASMIGASTLSSGSTVAAIVGQTAINTAFNGGDFEAAVKSALIQQGLPAAMKSDVMQTLNKDMVDVLGKYGAQATTQAGLAAILGKDPVAAFVFSGAQAATDLIMKQAGAGDALKGLPPSAQDAVRASITAGLTGKDAATAAANSLVNSMVKGAQTAISAAIKTDGKTILTGDQIKAVGESAIQPTSGALLDNTIRYAKLMQEGKVPDDPSTLTYVSSLSPSEYANLERSQMSLVPTPETTPEPTPELTPEKQGEQNWRTATGAGPMDPPPTGVEMFANMDPAEIRRVNDNANFYNRTVQDAYAALHPAPTNNMVFDLATLSWKPASTSQPQIIPPSNINTAEVNAGTQQLVDAITNPQVTPGSGTQVADVGRAGDPGSGVYWDSSIGAWRVSDEGTQTDSNQTVIGLPPANKDESTETETSTGGSETEAPDVDADAAAREIGFPNADVMGSYGGDIERYRADLAAERNHQTIMDTFRTVLGRDPRPEEYARFAGQNAIDVALAIKPSVVDNQDTIVGGQDTIGGGQDTLAGGQDTATGGQDTSTGGQDTTGGGQDTMGGGQQQSEWPKRDYYTDGSYTETYEDGSVKDFNPDGTEMVIGIHPVVPDNLGGGGQDTLIGGGGQDTTGGGQDTIGGGQDTTGGGQDTLIGGGGQDTSDGGQDTTDGGCGDGFHDDGTGLCVADDDDQDSGECADGFHDDGTGLCVADDDDKANTMECPVGQVRNVNTGLCEPVSTGGGGQSGTSGTGGNKTPAYSASFSSPTKADATTGGGGSSYPMEKISPTFLKSTGQQEKIKGALDEFFALEKSNTQGDNQGALPATYQQPQNMNSPFYNYGQDQSIDDIMAMGQMQFAQGGLATPLMAVGGATGTRHGRYATGGTPSPLVAAGGKMRVDFRRGDAVTGAGDGQSDDIPAMLADGEFVFPADVVAAIGNGSTKAGSDKLYDMMHSIRAHVRSAKPEDLPPEIKSPLDFLKSSRKKARS